MRLTMKKTFSFLISLGAILLILDILSTRPLQDYVIKLPQDNISPIQQFNVSQHNMNTSTKSTRDIRTHTIKEDPNKTFGSFIGIPYFYIKHGYHSLSTNDNLLTLCTICSSDFLRQAQTLATNYRSGPLSLAVYIDQDITNHTIVSIT
eukprot:462160_1